MNLMNTIREMAEKKGSPPWDTGKQDYAGAAKELKTYAMKDGGIDKKDMLSVANQLASLEKQKSASVLAKMMRNIQGLDTDVREKIQSILKKHGLTESVMEAWLAEAPEDDEPASEDEGSMAEQQLSFIAYAADELDQHIKNGGDFPEWMQNKLSTVNDNMQSLHAQIDHGEIGDKEEVDEGYSPREIKMAIGIASDKRYAGGNMTGAVKAIEKIKKGLSDHKQVAAVLKRQNEDLEEAKEVLSRFRDDKLKQSVMNLATQKGLKVKEMGDKLEVSGNAKKVMDLTLAVQKHDVKIEELEEAVNMDKVRSTYSSIMKGDRRGQPEESEVGDYIPKGMTKADIAALIKMLAKQGYDPKFLTKDLAPLAEAKRDPSKSGGSGYDLYHKDFSTAMQHAYKYAKDKLGITIDPKEIDDKVASGPRKPSAGKTNTYRLKGDKGSVQIQVANLDNKKYELNMYKEEVELDEAFTTAIKFPNYFKLDQKERDKIIAIYKKYRGKVSSQVGKDGSVTVDGDATSMRKAEAELKKASVKFVATESVEEGRVYVKTPEGDAYDAGKKAVEKGISYDKNPNKKGTKEYLAWSKGHNDARATKTPNKHFGQPRLSREEVELDEMRVLATVGKTQVVTKGDGVARVMVGNKEVASGDLDDLAGGWFMSRPGERGQKFFDTAKAIANYYKEEVTMANVNEAFNAEFGEKGLSLEDTLLQIWNEGKVKSEDNTNDKSDDGEGMDKVQPKALKKKFKDRKDKDIDNDGDVDDSDEYLHKRRQTVSKEIENEEDDVENGEGGEKTPADNGKKKKMPPVKDSDDAEVEQDKEVSDKEDEPKKDIGKKGKQTKVDVNPDLDEDMSDKQKEKREEIVKELKKKQDYFEDKYGDRAKDVMYATATKMAMKQA